MSALRRRCGALAAAVTGLALLAGCTALPHDSSPRIVRSVAAGPRAEPVNPVARDAQPRAVVNYFLDGNANVNDTQYSAAHSVLTADGNQNWSPSTVTVLDQVRVGNPTGTGNTRTVTVSGQVLGTVDGAGRYTPTLTDKGSAPYSRDFTLVRVSTTRSSTKQWRIKAAPKGVVLTLNQFEENYPQRVLYFFDNRYPASTTRFVLETRYFPVGDPQTLANALVDGLQAGDPGNNAIASSFPPVSNGAQASVVLPTSSGSVTSPARVDVPGAHLFGTDKRNALAAQLAATLSQVSGINQLQITDNGAPVRVSAAGGYSFPPDYAALVDRYRVVPGATSSTLFYVDGGTLHEEDGSVVKLPPAPKAAQGYSLSSVAMDAPSASGRYQVAAVYGTDTRAHLAIGTEDKLRVVTAIRGGDLSRPSWQPDGAYAWVGAGTHLYRVSRSGQAVLVTTGLPGGQRLAAVRVSPDGSRIALVVSSPGADGDGNGRSANDAGVTSQVYVGTIEVPGQSGTDGSGISITALQPITPVGVLVNDVSWYNDFNLFVAGRYAGLPGGVAFYEVQCDGSALLPRPTDNLPDPPESLTITEGSLAVVSVGNTMWRLSASGEQWVPDHPEGLAKNPVYVE